ncbi:MAG: hypothetical protein NTV38_14035, partial [Chloroflexi bacterium]|nr:hypothetical protein [Chloroflexota bacterium]
ARGSGPDHSQHIFRIFHPSPPDKNARIIAVGGRTDKDKSCKLNTLLTTPRIFQLYAIFMLNQTQLHTHLPVAKHHPPILLLIR